MCPGKLGPNAGLAIAAGRAGDIDRAVHYFHKSLSVDPHNKVLQIFTVLKIIPKILIY